jgi:hypothetical protein
MSKFNKLYEEIITKDHPIFKPASKEEIKRRKETKFQRWLEDGIESGNITKNPDGTYDVKGNVNMLKMGLTKIPIKFNKVDGNFWCYSNKNLTSLEGAPKEVNGEFNCGHNYLTSLKGVPKEVGGLFYCSSNKLTSLEGAPKKVNGDFYCSENNLTSLKGAPEKVNGDFYCNGQKNNHEFTKEEVEAVCKVKGRINV